jgi:hypothetical protein
MSGRSFFRTPAATPPRSSRAILMNAKNQHLPQINGVDGKPQLYGRAVESVQDQPVRLISV